VKNLQKQDLNSCRLNQESKGVNALNNRALSIRLMPTVGVLLFGLISSGCEQQRQEEISWQLPLSAPEDPHGSDVLQQMPDWATAVSGSAVLVLLEKNTARVYKSEVSVGDTAVILSTEITVLGAASGLRLKSGSYINDGKVDNPAVFVEVTEQGTTVYRGWLYEKFPELFGPDAATWKLWLEVLHIDALPEQNEDSRKRS